MSKPTVLTRFSATRIIFFFYRAVLSLFPTLMLTFMCAEAREVGHWGTWVTKAGWMYEGPTVDNHFDKDCIMGYYRLTSPGGEVAFRITNEKSLTSSRILSNPPGLPTVSFCRAFQGAPTFSSKQQIPVLASHNWALQHVWPNPVFASAFGEYEP